MIFTSYFANIPKIRKGRRIISISQITPQWAKINGEYKELAPTKSILFDYKNGEINDKEYVKRYKKEVLSKLDPKKVYKDLNNSIIMCYEKRGDFCHRHIVSEWLKEHGFKSEELKQKAIVEIYFDKNIKISEKEEKIIQYFIDRYENIEVITNNKNVLSKIFKNIAFSEELFSEETLYFWNGIGKKIKKGFTYNVETQEFV